MKHIQISEQHQRELMNYVVFGTSMTPIIHEGDIVYVASCQIDQVRIGDIVAFFSAKGIVIHRAIHAQYNKQNFIICMGDASPNIDLPVYSRDFIGKVVYIESGTSILPLPTELTISRIRLQFIWLIFWFQSYIANKMRKLALLSTFVHWINLIWRPIFRRLVAVLHPYQKINNLLWNNRSKYRNDYVKEIAILFSSQKPYSIISATKKNESSKR